MSDFCPFFTISFITFWVFLVVLVILGDISISPVAAPLKLKKKTTKNLIIIQMFGRDAG